MQWFYNYRGVGLLYRHIAMSECETNLIGG